MFVLGPVQAVDLERIIRRNSLTVGYLRSVIKWMLVLNYIYKWVYFSIPFLFVLRSSPSSHLKQITVKEGQSVGNKVGTGGHLWDMWTELSAA